MNPKTGSISLCEALKDKADKARENDHTSSSDLKKRYPDYEVWTVVREPIDWIESFWYYLRKHEHGFDYKSKYSTHNRSLKSFVQGHMLGETLWPEPYRFQHEYVTGADRVFSFDNLNEYHTQIKDRLGFDFEIPHLNKSEKQPRFLSSVVVERLEEHLSEDYNIYNKWRYHV